MRDYTKKCIGCNQTRQSGWTLSGYYGLSGYFCGGCYDKVSHDSRGQPNHPEEYVLMLLRLSGSEHTL